MTNEPRRLSQSGGVAQRLLDSASLDVPSAAARRRAAFLAATASSFTSTMSGSAPVAAPRRPNVIRTLATWTLIGAAASVALAVAGSKLFAPETPAAGHPAAPVLAELPAAPPRAPDIVAEPEVAAEPATIATTPAQPTEPNADELRQREAARQALALQIQALRSSGKTAEARALASEYQRKYPGRPRPDQGPAAAP